MKKPLQILVRDSYHTDAIAESIAEFMGKKAICYAGMCPQDVKIDVFVLSGKNILDGFDRPALLKAQVGSENAKVVATSAVDEILAKIMSHREAYDVDFAIYKSDLVSGLIMADSGDGEWKAKPVLNQILELFKVKALQTPPPSRKKAPRRQVKSTQRRRRILKS